jgi:hypothetical protein
VQLRGLTTRRLMGLVLIVAIGLGTVLGTWRWIGRISKAQFHAAQAMGHLAEAADEAQRAYDEFVNGDPAEARKAWRDSIDQHEIGTYHMGLATKYNRAVWRFWKPVAPDGPPPAPTH